MCHRVVVVCRLRLYVVTSQCYSTSHPLNGEFYCFQKACDHLHDEQLLNPFTLCVVFHVTQTFISGISYQLICATSCENFIGNNGWGQRVDAENGGFMLPLGMHLGEHRWMGLVRASWWH
jgi:hypothetical protein